MHYSQKYNVACNVYTSHVILGKQENIKQNKNSNIIHKNPICVGTQHGNNSLVVLKTKTSSVKNFISIMNFSTTTNYQSFIFVCPSGLHAL